MRANLPHAVGRLTLDPPGVGSTKWWAIIQTGEGLYLLYKEWLQRHPSVWERNSPGGWVRVRDSTRRTTTEEAKPRLAWSPLELRPSRWGAHVSVILGEKPRKNLLIWNLRAQITRMEGDTRSPRWKLDKAYRDWDLATRGLQVPRPLEGVPFRFRYDPRTLNRSRKGRWCLHAFSDQVSRIRRFFGLNLDIPRHAAPLHLTVGKEDARGGMKIREFPVHCPPGHP